MLNKSSLSNINFNIKLIITIIEHFQYWYSINYLNNPCSILYLFYILITIKCLLGGFGNDLSLIHISRNLFYSHNDDNNSKVASSYAYVFPSPHSDEWRYPYSVSYTPLDVYKRQSRGMVADIVRLVRCAGQDWRSIYKVRINNIST